MRLAKLMFRVSITSRAERELKRLDRPVKNRVASTIQALAPAPHPHGGEGPVLSGRGWNMEPLLYGNT